MYRKVVRGTVIVLLAFFILVQVFKIQPATAEFKIWTVDDDGPADFRTISAAVNVASSGDSVYVHTGTYFEHVTASGISLVGENTNSTIIDGSGTGTVVKLGENASITRFTIRNGEYGVQAGTVYAVFPRFTGNRIQYNYITGNRYGGIYLAGCANTTIIDNVVTANSLFGINLYNSGNNTIVNNTVLNNGHGIDFYGNSNDNFLRNNSMVNNMYNFGLVLRGETWNWVAGSRHGIVNDVDTSNTVNGKPVYYWVNRHDEQVPSDAGYVWLTDCNNVSVRDLDLSNNLQGVLLLWTNNSLVADNRITHNAYGIYVAIFSNNNTILGNTLQNNLNGIYLGDISTFTTMKHNDISGGLMNFGVSPRIGWGYGNQIGFPPGLMNDIDDSNMVDGKHIIYWINQHSRRVPRNTGYVMLINSTDILVEGLQMSKNVQNVFVLASNNTVIKDSSITNAAYGIDVRGISYILDGNWVYDASFNTTVRANVLSDNAVGMRLIDSNFSTVSGNMLVRNPLGICLADTSNSTITENLVVASDMNTTSSGREIWIFLYPEWPWERADELMILEIGGIIVGGVCNTISGNTLMYNRVGVSMNERQGVGTENVIFHNNFINNAPHQALEAARGSNHWDNGYPSGGNYWSNYQGRDLYMGPFQNETGSDGIGDSECFIEPSSPQAAFTSDNYPLMKPLVIPKGSRVGVRAGDWVRLNFTLKGVSETQVPMWMKVEFQNVTGILVTVNVYMYMSDGIEGNQTITTFVVAGGGAVGFIIPPESAIGDSLCMTGYGLVRITGETVKAYAGAKRVVVYTSFSPQYGTNLTYYWDKKTGVLVEATEAYLQLNMTLTGKAVQTNLWRDPPEGDLNEDGRVDIVDLTIFAAAFSTHPGDPRWNPIADIDENGMVNIVDGIRISKNFGKTLPSQE